MLELTKDNYIKPYSVKIEYKNSLGSGVIIRSNNFSFLFTAKHVFKRTEREILDVRKIQLEFIEVLSDGYGLITVKHLIYYRDDFIVFGLSNMIDNLPLIKIFKDNYSDEDGDNSTYFSYGYPIIQREGHFLNLKDPYKTDRDPLILKLYNKKHTKIASMEGMSGSGVFIRDGVFYYLARIILNVNDELQGVDVFDLSLIIDEVNEYLSNNYNIQAIPTKEYVFDMKSNHAMYKRIINRNKNNFLVKKVGKYFGDIKLNEINHNPENLDKFLSSMNNNNQFKKLEQKYKQELADLYLLGSFIANEKDNKANNNNSKAERLLDEAIKYNKNYRRYYKYLEGCKNKKQSEKQEDPPSNFIRHFIISLFIILLILFLIK